MKTIQSRNQREGHYVGCTQGIHVRERCNASSVYWHKHRDSVAAYNITLERVNKLFDVVYEMYLNDLNIP